MFECVTQALNGEALGVIFGAGIEPNGSVNHIFYLLGVNLFGKGLSHGVAGIIIPLFFGCNMFENMIPLFISDFQNFQVLFHGDEDRNGVQGRSKN